MNDNKHKLHCEETYTFLVCSENVRSRLMSIFSWLEIVSAFFFIVYNIGCQTLDFNGIIGT